MLLIMKAICLLILSGGLIFGGEREVWYGADGKAVRVIEDGQPVKESYQPPWERREVVVEKPRGGEILWDQRVPSSGVRYSEGSSFFRSGSSYYQPFLRWNSGHYRAHRWNVPWRGRSFHRGHGGGVRYHFLWK